MRLSKNFVLSEMTRSNTARRKGISNEPEKEHLANLQTLVTEIIQPMRDAIGPIRVTSGYRSPKLNRAIGGSSKSQHCKGMAADFEIFSIPNNEVSDWIKENLMFDQLILEYYQPGEPNSGWIHCSYNPEVNANRKEYLMAIKDENGKTQYKPILGLSTDRYVK